MPFTGPEPNLPGVAASIAFEVNGRPVTVPDDGASLLEVLRDRLGLRAVKDGCSPQGQCGCCTVWVDGAPRVACVTPVARVAGRRITTPEGLLDAPRWAAAFCAAGASQCGFCTPGIVMRLAALAPGGDVGRALLAHLCRCTGWQTIFEAASADVTTDDHRDLEAAGRRAAIEGGVAQRVGPNVALGEGGFADDTAPLDALVAVRGADDRWFVGETLTEARAAAATVPGRRTTLGLSWPLAVPDGEWARSLRTTWVEPGYLEPDASWCFPGGEPVSALANGGAFGGKAAQDVREVARRLANQHGRAVRVLYSREDVVRLGPKRPPIAAGVTRDGEGIVRVVRTPGIAEAIATFAPRLRVEEVDVAGLRTSTAMRAAGWAEAAVLVTAGERPVVAPNGAEAEAVVDDAGVRVRVRCGEPLDRVVLRSYCIGAAHMALGWVRNEGIAVDDLGEPRDLTIRSFGILRAVDMPRVEVEIDDSTGVAINGSDAVFAAVTAAAWRYHDYAPDWPLARR